MSESILLKNTSGSQDYKRNLKETAINIMNSSINNISIFKDFSESEKILTGFYIYKYLNRNLNNNEVITTELSIYLKLNAIIFANQVLNLKQQNPNKFNYQISLIEAYLNKNLNSDNKYETVIFLYNFYIFNDKEIFNILNSTYTVKTESNNNFSVKLFNWNSSIILDDKKIRNLYYLYWYVFKPIDIYYNGKVKITSALNSSDVLQKQGYAMTFYIEGESIESVYNNIYTREIDCEFDLLEIIDNKIYISLFTDINRIFYITESSNQWTIYHNLRKYPKITILNNDYKEIEGEITHISDNEFIINFGLSITGLVVLN